MNPQLTTGYMAEQLKRELFETRAARGHSATAPLPRPAVVQTTSLRIILTTLARWQRSLLHAQRQQASADAPVAGITTAR